MEVETVQSEDQHQTQQMEQQEQLTLAVVEVVVKEVYLILVEKQAVQV